MPSWRSVYTDRMMSARDAIGKIHSPGRIFLGSGGAEPRYLFSELIRQRCAADISGETEIVHLLSLGHPPCGDKEFTRHFRYNSFFLGEWVRNAVFDGYADYTPILISEVPTLFRNGRMPLDAVLIQVSPPDQYGFCSFGVSVEAQKAAAEAAEIVIAQVNPRMPRTLGESFIHVSELDCIVEYEEELIEVSPSLPDKVSRSIASHISRLVEDGSTIQVGIGKIPNAVLAHLADKKDLGVHTCMFSDGLIDLIEAGVITNAKKTFHPGKVLSSFCIGTRRLYDYVDNNPLFEFYPTDYNSSPVNIARNENIVAINTALEVDLTGQVCASSLGYRIYSGIGGQADFIRGAALAPNGKPIIALPSTAKGGTVSRIVPHLAEGAGVETTRGDVHYVATEYGIACLHGKNLRERAVALINIAHPKFRDKLMTRAKAYNFIFEDQIIPSDAVYPIEMEHTGMFEGLEVFFRPVKPSDERMLQEFLYHLSERSVYQRFFHNMKAFPHDLAQNIVAVDYREKMGVVGILGAPGHECIIANGHWIRDEKSNIAEISFAVADRYQRRGIGTHLLQFLMRLAQTHGIRGFEATVIGTNAAMMKVFQRSGCVIHREYDSGIFTLSFDFDEKAEGEPISRNG